jgi:elongator complex protein 1
MIPGLGKGREGRHDVAFFEPNGLRHGEFNLKVERWWRNRELDPKNVNWGYRVKDLLWNADSTILAIWIEVNGDAGARDIGK